MTINGQVSWVYSSDLEASTRFYADVLGFDCSLDQGRARLFATSSSAWIGVCEAFEGRTVQPRGSLISLVTDDVDGWYQRLLSSGLDIEAPRRLEEFAIYRFSVTDPDGYRIEFQQFDR